jgi:XTP/dITP diphosphohydrolase
MKEVIIATKNPGKAKEFVRMFQPLGFEVKTLLDFPEMADIEETGTTFSENAAIKAEEVSKQLNQIVISDDSGLIVDALDGRPGVFSARYAGMEKNDEANMEKVLVELKSVTTLEDRSARFHCSLAVAIPGKDTYIVEGDCEGFILFEKRGTHGFGYDPIFYVKEKQKSMAELKPEEKAEISHRAKALKQLEEKLTTLFEARN